MQKEVLDIDYLKSRFSYNEESGELRWKPRSDAPSWWNTRYAGKQPSNKDKLGYLRAKITRGSFSGYVSVHRICFFIGNGYLPEVVDHIDGDVTNNKLSNLRASDFRRNTWNRLGNKKTETGYKGVKVIKKNGRINGYTAWIGHNGEREYLGFFSNPEAARDAYLKRESQLRSEYVRKSPDINT